MDNEIPRCCVCGLYQFESDTFTRWPHGNRWFCARCWAAHGAQHLPLVTAISITTEMMGEE